MKQLGLIHDPTSSQKAYSGFDRRLLCLIKDERDLPFVHLTIRISLVLIPMSLVLFIPSLTGWPWLAVAAGHFYVSNFVFKGPFGLMLHCTSHRSLFRPEFAYMNHVLPWGIAPFFGHTPETYYSHHIGMHHPENNQEDDDSSTMPFQRDSLRSFLAYTGQFFVFGVRNLLSYLRRKNRSRLAKRALIGELIFTVVVVELLLVNWSATVAVFIFPLIIYRVIAMIGNWTQHAFVDGDEPGNPYKNSITCINVRYNKLCWNDGYHISHHIRPALHWTEHPVFFRKTIEQYSRNQAIIFDGLDFLQVFFLLMRRRYDRLAAHMINLNKTFASDADAIALLRRRTQRIPVVVSE